MTCAHAVCSGQGKPPGTPNAILPSRMPSPPCAVSCGSHSFLQPPGPMPISQISRAPFSNASPTPLATQPEMAKVKLRARLETGEWGLSSWDGGAFRRVLKPDLECHVDPGHPAAA